MGSLAIGYANAAAGRWAAWLVAASLDAAALLAIAGVVWLAIRRRVAPQVGHGLFLLVPLKLLVPVVLTVPAAWAWWTPSVVVSSWFEAERGPEAIGHRPTAETPATTAVPDRPTPLAVAADRPASRAERPTARAMGPASGPATHPVAEAPALSVAAGFLAAWLVGVALLLARLVAAHRRFGSRLRRMVPLDEAELGIDVRGLCRRAGVAGTVRIVEDDAAAVPAVWGIVRPTIILPRRITSALTIEQRQWVLLHELAHVRRRDLLVLLLQRLAAILHFFNPTIWIANRIIDQLREYACDDLAVALSEATGVESGEAFVRVLRHAERGRRRLEGALGIFGLDSRAACILRIRRLLDDNRPTGTAARGWSFAGLILLAALALPQLRAAGEAAPAEPQQAPAVKDQDAAAAASNRPFELLVVGPDGKAMPGAVVELRADPPITPERVRKGKIAGQQRFGTSVATDAEGKLVVELPPATGRFAVFITLPGHGPYCARWTSGSHVQAIPPRFTAELEAAWSVGGIVVDPEGKPVAGVQIRPSIEFKKPPGDTRQFGSGARVTTDAAGKWHFDNVPVSMADVHVEIDHPSFQPVRRRLARAEFGIAHGREPSARIVLNRGLTVTGKVADEAGKPIAGALVRTKFWNDVREARTGADGTYRLVGCEPKSARVVASAPGRAMDMKELNVEPGMAPVDFRLKPGGTVKVRVVDRQGNPVPRTRIFFQAWRGRIEYFEFDHVHSYADDHGVWVWNEAPLDEFRADICPPDGMQLSQQPLIARAEEYVFRVAGPLVVSGKVVDATTGEPIKSFRVIPGGRREQGQLFWHREDAFTASDGRYEIRQGRGEPAHLVRIEAEGYRAAVSREIRSDEGTVAVNFAMARGKDVVAKVVTPLNAAASGAKVAPGAAGSQIHVKNGEISEIGTFSPRATTDADGRFRFPAQDGDFELVITHPSGFAHIRSTPDWTARIIRLEPWARAEGTYRVGKTPAANVPIAIDVRRLDSYGEGVPRIYSQHEATTGPDGRFIFDRVIPGKGRIGRQITFMVREGATEVTSACYLAAEFPAGKTLSIDLGGTGRAVVGRLQPRDGFADRVRWNFAVINALPAGAADNPDYPHFRATVDRDGRFRIDDMPPGRYSLDVRVNQEGVGGLRARGFEVPAVPGDHAEPPVDLGVLRLERR